MKLRTVVGNGILAALYIAVSTVIQPFGFTQIQFRVSEMLNHLVVFNKKYIFGMVLGVFITNLLFSPMKAYDLVFGVGHTLISLLLTIGCGYYVKDVIKRMIASTLIFTFNMFIIAFELKLAFGVPFLFTWLTTAVGEFIVMAVGIPIMYTLNKRIQFEKLI